MAQCAGDQFFKCAGTTLTVGELFQQISGTATITGFKRATYDAAGVADNVDCDNLSFVATFPSANAGQTNWNATTSGILIAADTFNTPGFNNFDIIVCGSDASGNVGPCLLNVTVLDPDQSPCNNAGNNNQIDCSESFVDASEACDGRVRVCLKGTNGNAYFGNYDINGGPASNGAASTTGFTSTNNNPNYTQTDIDPDPSGFQCFHVNYTAGTQTTDTLVIQATDGNNSPVGDACSLSFSPSTSANCGGNGTALTCGTSTFNVTSGQVIPASNFVQGGSPAYTVVSATAPLTSLNGAAQVSGGTSGTSTVVIQDSAGASVSCTVTVNVASNNCIDVFDSTVAHAATAMPGSTINIIADINPNSGGLAGYFISVKDPAGNSFFPSFVATNQWAWSVPNAASCTNGPYSICIQPPVGSNCPEWADVGTITVSGCSDTEPCNITSNGASSSGGVDSGNTVTITLPTNQCNCPGYAPTFNDVTNYPADGSLPPISLNQVNSHTVNYDIPSNAAVGNAYDVHVKCCKVA